MLACHNGFSNRDSTLFWVIVIVIVIAGHGAQANIRVGNDFNGSLLLRKQDQFDRKMEINTELRQTMAHLQVLLG
jgi:hypothetical protein